MKVIGLTKDNCPKCAWAKRAMNEAGHSAIWLDADSDAGKALAQKHNVEYVPFFIFIDDAGAVLTTTKNVLSVLAFLRKP